MTCRLCELDKELRQSHIVPKFVYRWLKESGGDYFRSPEKPNQRLHDGVKPKMLCHDCEQLFSKYENIFASNIFYPHVRENKTSFEYDTNLLKFAISILWRVLQQEYSIISQHPNHSNKLYEAEKEWRDFLFKNIPIKKFSKIHVFFTTHGLNYKIQPIERFLYYYARATDGSVYTNNKIGFVYAKLSRVIIIAEIANDGFEFSSNIISSINGNFETTEIKLGLVFKIYLINRLRKINSAFGQISENQKGIVLKYSDEQMQKNDISETAKINFAQLRMKIDESFLDF